MVNEGTGTAGAGAVHTGFQCTVQENDLGVFAAQLNDHIGIGGILFSGNLCCIDFLHKVNIAALGHTHAGRAGDHQVMLGFSGKAVFDSGEHLHYLGCNLGEMALIGRIHNFFQLVHNDALDSCRANI